jgi:predicted nucleic acid-binding protein
MSDLAFFDTNVIVYAHDQNAPDKRAKALSLLRAHRDQDTIVISLQVLQEYFVTIVRKFAIPSPEAQRNVEILAYAKVVRFTEADILTAIRLHQSAQISFWDAMIVHAARVGGASVLFTEDLQHGATIAGVRIENPFREL